MADKYKVAEGNDADDIKYLRSLNAAKLEQKWEYASEEGSDYEWEYETESEEEDGSGKEDKDKAKEEEEKEEEEDSDISLDDIDLPDPFSNDPVPVIEKVAAPATNGTNGVNGTKTSEEKKKHKKHHKKSRHHDKFEKFRKLEEKEKKGEDDSFRSKKIHVRSKDPSAIARQFEKGDKAKGKGGKPGPKPPKIEVNKLCPICGKEPYLVERLVAEKSWYHKTCFRCKECNKLLTLDTYKSHEGVIYCVTHHRDLFKPKTVVRDVIGEIQQRKEMMAGDSSADTLDKHRAQANRMETIVRENKPVKLEGVVKSRVDDSKWEGLDSLDVGSKFAMFEKGGGETSAPSDRYGIMEKLKRLQAGEDVEELLAEIDEELPSDDEEEDLEEAHLTKVQKKAHNAEKLFAEETRKDKLADVKKAELKALREKLMAGTIDNIHDSFDEQMHRKIKKTKVDVRSATAKKFMQMFDDGKVPEGVSASDKMTIEKEAELEMMRTKKRGERDFFKKMESGELDEEKTTEPKQPKLLVGKFKDTTTVSENGNSDENGELEPEHATLSKKFSFFEHFEETSERKGAIPSNERSHAAKECKASAVLNKFKDMEKRAANGEPIDDEASNRRPLKRFTPPRKLGEESGSEYSDSEYSYSDSDDYSSSDYSSEGEGEEEDEYLKSIREAARAKELRAKFEEWEAQVGEDGGYTNLVDEDGRPLETASKLRNRFERLNTEEAAAPLRPKYQVKRFKPKEAYEHQNQN